LIQFVVLGQGVVDQGKMTLPVKKSNQVLLDILNKGVARVSPNELREIADKWLQ